MDKFVLILFVLLGVLVLVLGCVLMVGMMNDMEKWEENDIATDTSGQAYSTAQPLDATVTEQRTEPFGDTQPARITEATRLSLGTQAAQSKKATQST